MAVTEAMPQKNWATQTMNSRNFADGGLPSASRKIWAGGRPVSEAASAVRPSSDLSVIDGGDRVQQDAAADHRDQHAASRCPRGAAREAFLVSSATWAEAS